MTTAPKNPNRPDKHAALPRPALGEFGRCELSLLGTPCGEIQRLAIALIERLSDRFSIAYVDADHGGEEGPDNPFLRAGAALHYQNKVSHQRLDYRTVFNEYQRKPFFGQHDLTLVNGNHFGANAQVVVVDPAKSLEKKLDRLTNVRGVLLKEGVTDVPAYLAPHLPGGVPVGRFEEVEATAGLVTAFLRERQPPLNGLVLAGGRSTRMRTDKGLIAYHGKAQREFAYELLSEFCANVFISCRADQATLAGFNYLPDTFLELGPTGGILSAFRHQPDAAWLVLACDLPYLDRGTLAYLVENRQPSKVATTFLDPAGEFPEPLVTIYEPKSYPVLLQMLGLGYACPRKTLLNADVARLRAPDARALTNVNEPGEYEAARKYLDR
ncbi:MAG: NTP transferase domain-containing protein [Ferruginibacter sp.]|nr:NTP transferase domain-containing protein [Cytophagales bacterium]